MEEYQAVVMIGNLSDGWRIVGPFPTWDDAFLWDEENRGDEMTWIATVYPPDLYAKTKI